MAWVDKLRPASFRGVAAFVDNVSTEGGRYVALHEFAGGAPAFAEDISLRARRFAVEFIVLGEDYQEKRDALEAALEQPGPGTLVHPTRGSLRVSVLDQYRTREGTSMGGMAAITASFVLFDGKREPTAVTDTEHQVEVAADAADAAAGAEFTETYAVDSRPEWLAIESQSRLQRFNDKLEDIRSLAPTEDLAAAAFVQDLRAVASTIGAISRIPEDIKNTTQDLTNSLSDIAANVRGSLRTLRELFAFDDDQPEPVTDTATRERDATNAKAFRNLVQRSAIIQAARVAPRVDLESANELIALRDELSAALHEQALDAEDDDVYTALIELRNALIEDLDTRALKKPQVVSFTPETTLPALLIAYRLHDDATRDQEIIERNRITYPGFVTGGLPLEVLSD